MTEGKTLVQREDLGDQREDLGDHREDLCDQRGDLGDQMEDLGEGREDLGEGREEKEIGWAKPNHLPAGPREKWPIGRLFSSMYKLQNTVPPLTHQEHCVVKSCSFYAPHSMRKIAHKGPTSIDGVEYLCSAQGVSISLCSKAPRHQQHLGSG